MNEYVPLVSSVITGISAVVIAYFAWRLKERSDDKSRVMTVDKERRDETKHLYTSVFVVFELAIKQVGNHEKFTLDEEISRTNAKIHLLASGTVIAQYGEVASCLEEWSRLFFKASPRRMTIGDQTAVIIQAPDPTAEFKEPARAAYVRLQEELRKLVQLMRAELVGIDKLS